MNEDDDQLVEVECSNCGVPMMVEYYLEHGGPHVCSNDCYNSISD